MKSECPYCGNQGMHAIYSKTEYGEKWIIYECDECGAEFERVDPNG